MRVWGWCRGVVAVVAVAACCLVVVAGSGASAGRLRVATQFQPPAGEIELIAVVFKARFDAASAPLHPLVGVSLPGAGPPRTYGLLSGERRGHVQGKVATYVWLTLALKPLGAKGSHDQPLVGESLLIMPIGGGPSPLHPASERLTIDTSTPAERAQFASALRAEGVTSFTPGGFAIHAFDDGRTFKWKREERVTRETWLALVGATLEHPEASPAAAIGSVEAALHTHFRGGPSSGGPTLSGDATPGSLPGTVDVALRPPSTGINAIRLIASTPDTIKATNAPQGWNCLNNSAMVVQCQGPTATTPLTFMLSFTGTSLPSLSAAGSTDGGESFGQAVALGPSTPTPTPGSLSVTCPSGVNRGQSIRITITVPIASELVKDTWTLPDSSTIVHTAIPDSSNPKVEHDAIGTNQAGSWRVVVSGQGRTATCPAITVS